MLYEVNSSTEMWNFTSSQPLQAHCNSTIIYYYQHEQNLAQFVEVLLVKLSDILHLSNFVRLFHRQSFALYGIRKYAQEIISQSSHFTNFSVGHPPRPPRNAYFKYYYASAAQ